MLGNTYTHQVINVVHERRLSEIRKDELPGLLQADGGIQLAPAEVVEPDTWWSCQRLACSNQNDCVLPSLTPFLVKNAV